MKRYYFSSVDCPGEILDYFPLFGRADVLTGILESIGGAIIDIVRQNSKNKTAVTLVMERTDASISFVNDLNDTLSHVYLRTQTIDFREVHAYTNETSFIQSESRAYRWSISGATCDVVLLLIPLGVSIDGHINRREYEYKHISYDKRGFFGYKPFTMTDYAQGMTGLGDNFFKGSILDFVSRLKHFMKDRVPRLSDDAIRQIVRRFFRAFKQTSEAQLESALQTYSSLYKNPKINVTNRLPVFLQRSNGEWFITFYLMQQETMSMNGAAPYRDDTEHMSAEYDRTHSKLYRKGDGYHRNRSYWTAWKLHVAVKAENEAQNAAEARELARYVEEDRRRHVSEERRKQIAEERNRDEEGFRRRAEEEYTKNREIEEEKNRIHWAEEAAKKEARDQEITDVLAITPKCKEFCVRAHENPTQKDLNRSFNLVCASANQRLRGAVNPGGRLAAYENENERNFMIDCELLSRKKYDA